MGAGGEACTLPFAAPCPASPCVCHPSPCRRVAMVRSLLAPYEQRPWAQTNWILVRLWKVSPAGGGAVAVAAGRKACPAPLTSTDPTPRAVGSGTAIRGCHTC